MHGFLNVNKPAGITSRAAVDLVKRLCHRTKIGHTGTLDPIASGVLVICLGDTTRLAEYIQRMPKTYRAKFLLDRRSETDDTEEGFETLDTQTDVSQERLQAVLNKFVGEIDQVPPKYSAAKVAGRRAYKLARQDVEFQLQPRRIVIHGIKLVRFEYPEIELEICCGSGTYVRSLGRDVADELGTCAVMSSLVRTAVGRFDLEGAVDVSSMDSETIQERLSPPALAVSDLRRLQLSDEQIAELRFGRTIDNSIADAPDDEVMAGMNSDGELVALLKHVQRQNMLRAFRNFNFS